MVLHASAVARRGVGMALIGTGGSGKNTLAAVLVAKGCALASDDVAPVDISTGHLLPVPVAQCLKSGSWRVLEPYFPGLKETREYPRLGERVRFLVPPRWVQETFPPRFLVFPRFRPGAETCLQPLDAAGALQGLVASESFVGRGLTAARVGGIVNWVAGIPAYALRYGDVDDAANRLLAMLLT